jgi:hypothetical protein
VFRTSALVLGLSGLLIGCPNRIAVWLEPASTINTLDFRISTTRRSTDPAPQYHSFGVVPCGASLDMAAWVIDLSNFTTDTYPTTIRYGATPDGYTIRVSPKQLTPGCYEFWAGGAQSRFTIDSDSTIHEEPF